MTVINSRNKPDIIEKLVFKEKDRQYIDSMIAGSPSPKVLAYWTRKGMDIERKRKYYTAPALKERKRILSAEYKIRMCCVCNSFPSVRLIWKNDGVQVLQYYCNDCYNNVSK